MQFLRHIGIEPSVIKFIEDFGVRSALDKYISDKKFPHPSTKARKILEEIHVDRFSISEKISLYAQLKDQKFEALKNQEALNKHLLFNIKDLLLREAYGNPAKAAEIENLADTHGLIDLKNEIHTAGNKGSILLPLVQKANQVAKEAFKSFELQAEPGKVQSDQEKARIAAKKYRSLFVSVEYDKASVAGVGSVVNSLSRFMNQNKHDTRVLTPFYDTFVEEHCDKAQFVTNIEHFYKGKWVSSAVYKVMTQNNTVQQYLVRPPFESIDLMEIGAHDKVYWNQLDNRTAYTCAVAAAFTSRYSGRTGQKQFDLMHLHSFYMTPTFRIAKEIYAPKRAALGLAPIAMVEHIHGASYYFEQGSWVSKNVFTDQGFDVPSRINMQAEGYRWDDLAIHVAENTAKEIQETRYAYSLEHQIHENTAQGRLVGIQNGIAVEKFQPTNQAVLKDFAFKMTAAGLIDFEGGRANIRAALHQQGILPDPNKPVFLYLGRFVMAKGIDVLPPMAEEILQKGGQLVIMGIKQGDPLADADIAKIIRLQKKYPNAIKVLTEISQQQAEFPGSNGVTVGNMLRAAVDYAIVPSHREPGGLVPKEFWASGAICVTSNVGGIGDNGRGLHAVDVQGQKKENLDTFNAFTYDDEGNYIHHAHEAVKQALDFHAATDAKKRNEISNRIYRESEATYGWDKSIAHLERAYENALKPLTKAEQEGKERVYNLYLKTYSGIIGGFRLRMHDFFTSLNWNHFKARFHYFFTPLTQRINALFKRLH